LRNYYKKIL